MPSACAFRRVACRSRLANSSRDPKPISVMPAASFRGYRIPLPPVRSKRNTACVVRRKTRALLPALMLVHHVRALQAPRPWRSASAGKQHQLTARMIVIGAALDDKAMPLPEGGIKVERLLEVMQDSLHALAALV